MQSFPIYKNLDRLNKLEPAEAESLFRDCCGSHRWARVMTGLRPFAMLEKLYRAAEETWASLGTDDWLEAFHAHPKIGSKAAARTQQAKSAEWSAGEQAGVESAAEGVLAELAQANCLYEEKFGFIFIVCATGKSADEMLAICRARLGNSSETEIKIAADEQRKITEIRLNKLLEK